MESLKSDSQLLLQALDIQDWERVISIREDTDADANFLITHIIKHVLQDEKRGLCLLTLQHSPAHYQHVGKRLNYNLTDTIKDGRASIIDPMQWIADDIGAPEADKKLLTRNTEQLASNLFSNIEKEIRDLLRTKTGSVYLIVDNLSILLDMGLDIRHPIHLINMLLNSDNRINIVINTHVSTSQDRSLATAMSYIGDIVINVDSLKTGKSFYVSGLIGILRMDVPNDIYQFKATDKGVKIFRPGEVINNLVL